MIAGTVKAGSRVRFSGQDLVSPGIVPVTKGGWNCANIAGHKGAPLGATVCIPGARIVRLRVNRLDTMLWHNVVTRLWPFPGTHITAVAISTHKDKIGLWAILMR